MKKIILYVILPAVILFNIHGLAGLNKRMDHQDLAAKKMVLRNIEDIFSLLKTAEHFLKEYYEHIQKAREFFVMGSNGIFTKSEREEMIKKIEKNIDECLRIVEYAQFNTMSVFTNGNKPYREFAVTLNESEPTKRFRICAPQLIDGKNILQQILKNKKSDARSLYLLIPVVDIALDRVSDIRAQTGAFYNRLLYIKDYLNIYLQTTNISYEAKQNRIEKHSGKIEKRMYSLSIQAANGIYTDRDRKQIDYEYQELMEELQLLGRIERIKHAFTDHSDGNIATQENAEKEMLRLAGVFKEKQ